MINRTSPARAGFSLIEVLVVLAVAGLFFAMGSALLYGYLRLNNASAYQLDSLTTWRDMADAWKRDIHLAKAAPTPLKPNDNTAQKHKTRAGTTKPRRRSFVNGTTATGKVQNRLVKRPHRPNGQAGHATDPCSRVPAHSTHTNGTRDDAARKGPQSQS